MRGFQGSDVLGLEQRGMSCWAYEMGLDAMVPDASWKVEVTSNSAGRTGEAYEPLATSDSS